MNATQTLSRYLGRGLMAFITLFLVGSLALGQTFTNTGSYTNSGTSTYTNFTNGLAGTVSNTGTMKIRTALTQNNLTTSAFDTEAGTVEYFGVNATQSIIANIKNSKYGYLAAKRGGTKTINANITVQNTLTLDQTGGASLVVDLNGKTLTLNGSGSPISVSSGTFTATVGTTVYNLDGAQNVYGTTYQNLTMTASATTATKTASGAVTVSGVLSNGAGITLDFGANTFTGTLATITNASTGTLQSGGVVSLTGGTSIGGTFVFNKATSTQDIPAVEFTNLTLSGGSSTTGEKVFQSGTTSVSGTYSVADADRNYTTNTSTFRYNGTTQSILAETYYSLTLVGGASDVKTAASGISLTSGGTLTNTTGIFDMGTFTLTVTGVTKTNTGTVRFGGGSNGIVFAGGTVEYNGTVAQTVTNGAYGTLVFSNGGATAKTITGGTTSTTASVTVSSGATLDLSASGILTVATDLTNSGSITNAGTITVGTD